MLYCYSSIVFMYMSVFENAFQGHTNTLKCQMSTKIGFASRYAVSCCSL